MTRESLNIEAWRQGFSLGVCIFRSAFGELLRFPWELRVLGAAGFARTARSDSKESALLSDDSRRQ